MLKYEKWLYNFDTLQLHLSLVTTKYTIDHYEVREVRYCTLSLRMMVIHIVSQNDGPTHPVSEWWPYTPCLRMVVLHTLSQNDCLTHPVSEWLSYTPCLRMNNSLLPNFLPPLPIPFPWTLCHRNFKMALLHSLHVQISSNVYINFQLLRYQVLSP